MTNKVRDAASGASSESVAADAPAETQEKVLRIRWDTKRRGHLLKYQFAEGHAATWDSNGQEQKAADYPVATVPESFWNEYGKDIRTIAGGTFTILSDEEG
jgi:hypothetical protein